MASLRCSARHHGAQLRHYLLVRNSHLHLHTPNKPAIMSAESEGVTAGSLLCCSLAIAEYIVVFKQGVTKDQIQKHAEQVNQNGALYLYLSHTGHLHDLSQVARS